MKSWFEKNRRIFLRAAGTGLAIILLIFLLYQNGWGEIQKALQRISLLHLLSALLCIILSRLLITLRWFVLLRSADVKISFKNTLSLVFTGLFANNFLPTTVGGDVVRLAGAIQLGFDQAICLASIAADRIINMVGMCLAAPLGIWQVIAIPAASGASQIPGLAGAGIFSKTWGFLIKTLESFKLWIKKPSALLLSLVFAIAHMTFSFSANYILINGLGDSLPLWKVLGLFSLAYFVSLVPISINGYGVQELTVTYLLSHFGGVSLPISATVAVLHRLLMVFVSLPGAFTLPGIMARMDQKQENPVN